MPRHFLKPPARNRCGGLCGGRTNEALHAEIVRRFAAGETYQKIARAMACSDTMIAAVLFMHGRRRSIEGD